MITREKLSKNKMTQITPALKKRLVSLADKYETHDFISEDPSQFLYYYKEPRDIELLAFTASLLSFGSRKQFIPKIRFIAERADISGGIYQWIKNQDYEKDFSSRSNKKFYRFYSYRDMFLLFSRLNKILAASQTLGIFFLEKYTQSLEAFKDRDQLTPPHLADLIADEFTGAALVPQTKTSAKKDYLCF